jgi:hypothetical protein
MEEARRLMAPGSDVAYREIEGVRCPSCDSLINDWFRQTMVSFFRKPRGGFDLSLPCCGNVASLLDFKAQWPAGFARFLIEARYATSPRFLADADLARIEQMLGCRLRQIMAP